MSGWLGLPGRDWIENVIVHSIADAEQANGWIHKRLLQVGTSKGARLWRHPRDFNCPRLTALSQALVEP